MNKQIRRCKRKGCKYNILGIIVAVLLLMVLVFKPTIHGSASENTINVNELSTGNSSYGNQVVDYYETKLNVDMGMELAATIEKEGDNKDKIIIKKIKGIDLFMSAERSLNFLIANQDQITEKKELGESSKMILYMGAKINYDRSKVAGNRVKSLRLKKTEIKKDQYYKVAMSQTLANSGDYPEIRDSKEEKNASNLLVGDTLKITLSEKANAHQENSRYELHQTVEKASTPNIYLMLLSTIMAIGLGVLGGWIYTRNKQKNNL